MDMFLNIISGLFLFSLWIVLLSAALMPDAPNVSYFDTLKGVLAMHGIVALTYLIITFAMYSIARLLG